MADRRRSHWGWGFEDARPAPAEVRAAVPGIAAHLGFAARAVEEPVALAALALPPPRLPAPNAPWARAGTYERALHHYGRGYRDVVRAFRGEFPHPPDVVARPRDEAEVEDVLAWAARADAAVVPWGGGTSVVGGVELADPSPHAGVVTLDLGALDRVLEVDEVSRAARIQAGARGPVLEAQLAERGLTLRHFPQSFELSTLGGWIATRAGGHFATNWTHVDDLVESVRAVGYAGTWESRRVPGSGAGTSPDRVLLGSEGILGVVTEAWMRVQARPVHRAGASVRFGSFADGAEAVRAIGQAALFPANLRLIDAREAFVTGAGDGGQALLVVGFESADHDMAPWAARARELCAAHGGEWIERGGGGGAWREAFLRAPYLRDTLVAAGIFSETFETAITWERFAGFHAAVTGAVEEALGGEGGVSCRFTHVYPDGPAPYFTILAPARRGDELAQWDELKAVAADAVLAGGGTITHHHAVGRDHRPWYDRQRPAPFAAALRAAKTAVDPDWRLNPGVLVDPGVIAVLGAGGVGGLVAAALARAGEDVVVVARAETAAALAASGISVRSVALGDFTAHPRVTVRLDRHASALVVATKAPGLPAALERVGAAPGLVVPLLNGIEHLATLRGGSPRVCAGVIRVESDRPSAGRIVQSSPAVRVDLAPPDDAVTAFAAILRRTGIDVGVSGDEAGVMWSKLCRLNALACATSAHDLPLGAIRDDPALSAELVGCVGETVAVARAEGARLDAAATLAELAAAPPGLGSSLRRDIAAGRETEVEAIPGAVLRAAARHGLACPVVARLYAAVRARARAGPG